MRSTLRVAVLLIAVGALGACGDDAVAPRVPQIAFTVAPNDWLVDTPLALQGRTPLKVTVTDQSGDPYIAETVSLVLGDNPGGAILTGTASGLTDANGEVTFADLSINEAALGYTLRAAAVGVNSESAPFDVRFKGAYLISDVAGPPWNRTVNEDAMDQAFGAGEWHDLRFETANLADLFTLYAFLFLEGSDAGADELEAFITANQVALEAFVTAGGRALINSAPNEGDGMSFGFGVNLVYDNSTSSVVAVDAGHPIFVATGTFAFTGGSFGHATVNGAGLTGIIEDAGDPAKVVLAEMAFGQGHALFGGMTTDNFHDPQPAAHDLRINIISYAAGN